ncbi:MAG: hypothetical protein IPH57_09890 [Saprospiraceae bacterium]|nr:hypothetical protein [Saprospiraceae bacterium]
MKHSERNILIDQLLEYIQNPYINQAVLLHGAWGSGKEVKVIYTSANGIASEQKIILQIYSKTILGKYQETKKGKVFSSLAMGAVRYGLDKLGSNLEDIDFKDFISFKENSVLVIDDIERLDDSYSLISFLGFVNNLSEHENVKVILIGEEDKLKEKLKLASRDQIVKSNEYEEVKEKYIYRTFYYAPKLTSSIPSIIDSFKDNEKFHNFLRVNQGLIIDIWQKLNVVNLRTIKFYLDSLFTIYNTDPDNIEKIKKHFWCLELYFPNSTSRIALI